MKQIIKNHSDYEENQVFEIVRSILEKHRIPWTEYALGSHADDSMCLTKDSKGIWQCFIFERGHACDVKKFSKLFDACEYLISSMPDTIEEAKIMVEQFKNSLSESGLSNNL